MKWYYMIRGDSARHGVADEARLAEMARAGRIGPEDLIWDYRNGTRWVPASSVPGLFASPARSAGNDEATQAAGEGAPVAAQGTSRKGLRKLLVIAVLLIGLVLLGIYLVYWRG